MSLITFIIDRTACDSAPSLSQPFVCVVCTRNTRQYTTFAERQFRQGRQRKLTEFALFPLPEGRLETPCTLPIWAGKGQTSGAQGGAGAGEMETGVRQVQPWSTLRTTLIQDSLCAVQGGCTAPVIICLAPVLMSSKSCPKLSPPSHTGLREAITCNDESGVHESASLIVVYV